MFKLYTFGKMSQIFNAKAENISANSLVKGLSIDSRTLKAGDLFFCVQGENTDGHLYISQALEKGANAVVANPEKIPKNQSMSQMIDLVKTIKTHTESSKSELSWGTFDHFKV